MADSAFKFYSLGIVAKDKPTKTDMIDVVPIEHITDIEKDINETKTLKSKAVDQSNKPQSTEIKSINTVTAKWISIGGSNRLSSPDVIAGETVLIYTYSDTKEYYWSTIFIEPSIRRLEKVLYSWCNLPTGARVKEFDRDSSYWAEVDTMNKYVKLHTSDNDGEVTIYDVIFNTKDGNIVIKDGFGNHFVIDSKESFMELKDKEGNLIKISSSSGKVEAKANKAIVLKAPVILLDGEVGMTGGMTGSGNLSVGGNIDSGGRIAANGYLSASGGCMASEHPVSSEGASLHPMPTID